MKKFILVICMFTAFHYSKAQINMAEKPANQPNGKEVDLEIPDPLTTFDGKKITTTRKWEKVRRPELLDYFTSNMYGKVPGELEISTSDIVEQSDDAINGKARRKQVDIMFRKNGKSLYFNILMYLPKNVAKAPLFLGYNFYGNHTINNDVKVLISDSWSMNNNSFGISNNQLNEKSRGVRTERWPVEKIIDAGYGLATIYYGDVDPDKDDFSDGVHPFFYAEGLEVPGADEWGAIAAWAWGLSRAMDYLENDPNVNPSKVIVYGHSRLGKAALWAGANDERFAGVISNNSGCGGAALSKRKMGETVAEINRNFPHWFCRNFKKFNQAEQDLPVDQHELIALVAPRPVYIASAEEDLHADPLGEFLAAFYAIPVYNLYGKTGISSDIIPKVNQPEHHTVAYHIRPGDHGVTNYDWEQFMKWANEQIVNK